MPSLQTYLFLVVAIALETVGTSALHAPQQFTRPLPTALMVASYPHVLLFLSHALKVIPMGVAYGIWSGLGIVLVSSIGLIVFKQKLDIPALIGLALIIAGVVVVNVFSKSMTH